MKGIQYNTIQACHETHADRELRENLIKERAAGPSMNYKYELGWVHEKSAKALSRALVVIKSRIAVGTQHKTKTHPQSTSSSFE